MPIILQRRIIEPSNNNTIERKAIAEPSSNLILKKRTIEPNLIQNIAPVVNKGISAVAEKTKSLALGQGFQDYDKFMAEGRGVIRKKVLSTEAHPSAPLAVNVAGEVTADLMDIFADPKWIIAGELGGLAGSKVIQTALKNPQVRTFAEKQLPNLLKTHFQPNPTANIEEVNSLNTKIETTLKSGNVEETQNVINDGLKNGTLETKATVQPNASTIPEISTKPPITAPITPETTIPSEVTAPATNTLGFYAKIKAGEEWNTPGSGQVKFKNGKFVIDKSKNITSEKAVSEITKSLETQGKKVSISGDEGNFIIIKEIITDLRKSIGNVGGIGNIKKTAEQLAAEERLSQNIKLLSEQAKTAGKDLATHLKDIGLDEVTTKAILAKATMPKPITAKYAQNINLNRLPENIRRPIAEVVKEKPIIGQTPHITHEELIKKASELKGTPTIEYLLSQPEGTLAAEALKARQGNVSTINGILSKDLGELSKSIKTDLEQPIGALRKIGSEVGRALEQQKLTPFQKQNITKKITTKISQIDKDPLFKGSKAGKALKENLNQLAKDITGDKVIPSNWDKLYYGWLNAILSDPRTHMVNIGSNTIFALAKIPERLASAIMDLPLTGLGKLGIKRIGNIPLTGERQVFFGEVPAMIQGLLTKGIKSPQAIGSKFEQLNLYAGDKFLPTGWLKQEDVWAKNVVGRMEMFAQMYKAKAMGKTGLLGLESIRREQLYRTFQNEPGVIAQWLMRSRNIPYIGPALFRWIMPFVKTPANIINTAIERTPAGIAFLGKAETKAQLSERLAYISAGSIMSAWAAINYLKGNITGDAPTDPAERDAFYAQGKQPNAIKLFGYWIPFERIEPVGTALSLVTNVIQDYKTSDKEMPSEKVIDAISGITQTLTNKTYFQGMTNMMKAMSDPEMYGSRWSEAIVSGMATPGLLNFIAQLKDPYIRQPEGITEKIKARIPGLSEQVTPKLTVFGEKIKRETSYLPIRISKEKDNLVRKELENLGVTPGFPAKTIGKQKLTQSQYANLLTEAGQKAYKALEWKFNQPDWKTKTQDEKEKFIDSIMIKSRDFPREKMAMSILLNGIKDAKTDKDLQDFMVKMKETKVLTKERFKVLWDRGLLGK